ncbi:MAG: FHA domain-containing protein [Anaerolineae bacterium]|nr:FHA domain-containing protein [Anaerolineae bacterium]
MQGNNAFRLIVRRGPQPNQVYELTNEVTNLGRDITNDIVINDREASRHHLRFMRGADGFTIEDLGSTNGTFVNGKRVTGATPLKNGDMVGLGETVTLQFEVVRPGAAPAQPVQAAQPEQPVQPQPVQPPQPSYTPPPVSEDDRYKPQQAAQPEQPVQQQPVEAQVPQQEYAQQVDPSYGGSGTAQAAYGPPPPGYDYDPYAMRGDEGSSTTQWFLIGCLGLLLLCCCLTVVLAVGVDTFCLYEDVPGLTNILNAIGRVPTC